MSSTKTKKLIPNRGTRRSEYIRNSSDYDSYEDDYSMKHKKQSNGNLRKISNQKWKGRVLERTRFSNNKVEPKSQIKIDHCENENEEGIEFEEVKYLYPHIGESECCRERLKIGRNLQINEFKSKIRKLLNDVYSLYINFGKSKRSSILNKTNEFTPLYQQINEKIMSSKDYLILFTKSIQENISENVKIFKNSIFEKMPIKTFKENYYDLKRIIHEDMGKGLAETNIPKKQIEQIHSKCMNENLQFCRENRKIIVSIINELFKIYKILLQACPILETIFKVAMEEIEGNYDVSLKMVNIHKEEFLEVIINDEFIKSLINEISNKDIAEFIEQRPLISNIEDELKVADKDMTKLRDLIEKIDYINEQFQTVNLSRLKDAISVHEYLIKQTKNYINVDNCININCNVKNTKIKNVKSSPEKTIFGYKCTCSNFPHISETSKTSNQISLTPPNISKVKLNVENSHKNLDELYEYIIADDDNKRSKQNKKNKNSNLNSNKKKQNQLPQDKIDVNIQKDEISYSYSLEIDKEIEDFKSRILTETIHANKIKKVKPKISKEWVEFIEKL